MFAKQKEESTCKISDDKKINDSTKPNSNNSDDNLYHTPIILRSKDKLKIKKRINLEIWHVLFHLLCFNIELKNYKLFVIYLMF